MFGEPNSQNKAQHQPLDLHSGFIYKSIITITFLFLLLSFFVDNYQWRKNTGPAVLIEVGYITNAQDVQAIKEQASKIATQIAAGIMNYTPR